MLLLWVLDSGKVVVECLDEGKLLFPDADGPWFAILFELPFLDGMFLTSVEEKPSCAEEAVMSYMSSKTFVVDREVSLMSSL